jgi:hypothetical protein
MRNRLLRIALLAGVLLTCAVSLGGCFALGGLCENAFLDEYAYDMGTDMRESVSEGYFKLSIDTGKDDYARGETIDCWAELEYIGEQDSITVWAYGDPIQMDMTGENVYYSASGSSFFNEKELTIKKGVPIRRTLAECLPKSSSVRPGQYQIDANVTLNLSPDGSVCYYGYVSAVIVVGE